MHKEAEAKKKAEAKRAAERAARVDAERAARSKRQRSQSEELGARTGAMGRLNPDAVRTEAAMKEAARAQARIRNGNRMARMNANDLTQDTGDGGTVKTFDQEGNQIPVSEKILTDLVTVKSGVGRNVWSNGQGLLRPEDGTPQNLPGSLGPPTTATQYEEVFPSPDLSPSGQTGAATTTAPPTTTATTAATPAYTATDQLWSEEFTTAVEKAGAWKSETNRKAQINSLLGSLEQSLNNFAGNSIAARKEFGEEGQRLFQEGHRNRLQLRLDLKEELAAFDTDGLQHGREIEKLLDAAGIKTSGMDSWGPERVYDELKQATGVMSGALPHPDDEDEDEGPVVFDPKAANEEEGWPKLTGDSNDVDTIVATRSLLTSRGSTLADDNLNPMREYFTDPTTPGPVNRDTTGETTYYLPIFENFNDSSDQVNYWGQRYKYTQFTTLEGVPVSLQTYIKDLETVDRVKVASQQDASTQVTVQADLQKKRDSTIRQKVKEQMILDVQSYPKQQFEFDFTDAEWVRNIDRIIDMAEAPIAPRSTTGPATQELYAKVDVWQNTYLEISLMDIVEEIDG